MNRHDSISQPRPIGGALRALLLPRRICARAGFTLIELLVVVTIVLMLFGLAATVMQPLREGRDIREAARLVSAYLFQAQTRAIQRGRPVGIRIVRLATQPDMALDLAMNEVPPPYGGDTFDAVAVVTLDQVPIIPQWEIKLATHIEYKKHEETGITIPKPIFANVPYLTGKGVRLGDSIRIGYNGLLRRIDGITPELGGPDAIITVYPPLELNFLPKSSTSGQEQAPITKQLPYQIYRYSMAQSPFDPLTLPASVAIDVANSGIGNGWFAEFDANNSDMPHHPVILFGPDGSVDRVIAGLYLDLGGGVVGPLAYGERPWSTIHLLIGRPEKLGTRNLADGNNLWVSIDKETGKVTTSDIFPVPEESQKAEKNKALKDARQFATGRPYNPND